MCREICLNLCYFFIFDLIMFFIIIMVLVLDIIYMYYIDIFRCFERGVNLWLLFIINFLNYNLMIINLKYDDIKM